MPGLFPGGCGLPHCMELGEGGAVLGAVCGQEVNEGVGGPSQLYLQLSPLFFHTTRFPLGARQGGLGEI